jgi:hypothetical protein
MKSVGNVIQPRLKEMEEPSETFEFYKIKANDVRDGADCTFNCYSTMTHLITPEYISGYQPRPL